MRERSEKFVKALAALDLADEAMFALGLVLLTVGLWTYLGAGALVAPGIVLLWLSLPTRGPFLPPAPPDTRRKTT